MGTEKEVQDIYPTDSKIQSSIVICDICDSFSNLFHLI